MHFNKGNQTLTSAEVLSDLTEACKRHFGFLETDHGLHLEESDQHGREFVVVYANNEYKVSIYLEYPGPPWIAVEKWDGKRSKRKGLHQLYKRAFQKDLPNTSGKEEKHGGAYDLGHLCLLSDILKKHWDKLVAAF